MYTLSCYISCHKKPNQPAGPFCTGPCPAESSRPANSGLHCVCTVSRSTPFPGRSGDEVFAPLAGRRGCRLAVSCTTVSPHICVPTPAAPPAPVVGSGPSLVPAALPHLTCPWASVLIRKTLVHELMSLLRLALRSLLASYLLPLLACLSLGLVRLVNSCLLLLEPFSSAVGETKLLFGCNSSCCSQIKKRQACDQTQKILITPRNWAALNKVKKCNWTFSLFWQSEKAQCIIIVGF